MCTVGTSTHSRHSHIAEHQESTIGAMQPPINICALVCVRCLLLHCLIHLSESDFSEPSVFSHVGGQAVFPCNWTSKIEKAQISSSLYLWWETPAESVFELKGNLRFEGPDYKGRVEVEPQSFAEGDCSLLLRDVQFSDAGLYESFISVGRKRSFIRSLNLNVMDYKYTENLDAGQRLRLKLHTPQAASVVFWGNSVAEGDIIWQKEGRSSRQSASEGDIIWQKGGRSSRQGRLMEGERELILSDIKLEDSGAYRVLDPQGRSISTVLLTVKEVMAEVPVPERRMDALFSENDGDARSSAFKASGTSLIMSSLLLFCLLIIK